MPKVSVLVEGGKATAGAPLGPALGPLGVNIGAIVAQINEKTKAFAGVKVPVEIIIDSATKQFEINVGSPPVSALIKKELGIPKGAANPKAEVKGNLSIEKVKEIAKMKLNDMNCSSIKAAVKQVLGTCNSLGVTVEGKKAVEIIRDIEKGIYDEKLKE
jgi:large subunit ribosomal protein L11